MIPPVPAATLEANPVFARVWGHVTTELLEGDGSARNPKGRWRNRDENEGDGRDDVDGLGGEENTTKKQGSSL